MKINYSIFLKNFFNQFIILSKVKKLMFLNFSFKEKNLDF